MAVLKILIVPDPRLHAKAIPVEKVDRGVRKLMDDLLDTMYDRNGVGLAAIQAGIQKRVVVIDLGERNGIPLNLFSWPILKFSGFLQPPK